MRDIASLFRAWRQLQAYDARGLKPAYRGAVFDEIHVPGRVVANVSTEDTDLLARDGADVERFLERAFRPTQPRLWRQ